MQMWSHVTHQTGDKAQGSLEEDTIKRCRQEQERALVTSPCTGNRERIRNRERGTSRERSRTKILRNDLSSRLEKSGSSPRQTYHSNVTTRSHLAAPACAPPWGQVTGRGKRHHRTTEHLLLRRKIYICLGITRLSAVMLLYLAAGKVQHAAWKASPDSALKHLLATESDPQASRLRGWADVLWWSEAQRGTSPSTALSCTELHSPGHMGRQKDPELCPGIQRQESWHQQWLVQGHTTAQTKPCTGPIRLHSLCCLWSANVLLWIS